MARISSVTAGAEQQRQPQKRGPKVHTDEELIAEIRVLLSESVFRGEGYRKIWARLL
jgi:hypothetical protein